MRLIKFCLLFIFTLALLGMLNGNTPPTVTNVSASQRTDGSKIVDVYFSVADADNDTLSVSLAVSNDNGATFSIMPSPANLSGAIGENILSGNNKHIVWNAGAEEIAFNASQFKVKVIATEKINLSNGLVAYYPFNGNANDESGNGHDGQLFGSPVFSPDRFNNASSCMQFDGADDYVDIGDWNLSGACTISLWAKTLLLGNDIRILEIGNGGSQLKLLICQGWDVEPDVLLCHVHNGSSINPWWGIDSPGFLQLNQWILITITISESGVMEFYRNGSLIASQSGGWPLIEGIASTQLIGYNTWGIHKFQGYMDDFRFYNRALSSSEIQALYHEGGWPNLNTGLEAFYPFNGNANDESGNGHDGIIHGSTLINDRFGNPNNAMHFTNDANGVAENWIDCGIFDLSNESFSFSIWSKDEGDCEGEFLISHNPNITENNNNYHHLHIGYHWETNPFIFGFYGDDLFTSAAYGSNPGWHHWICAFEATTRNRKIYRDGVLIANDISGDVYQGNGLLQIGKINWETGAGYTGIIDDLRIYNRVLSTSEILYLYHEGGWTGNP